MAGTPDIQFPVLIGDIGGTNARFQVIERPNGRVIEFEPVRTADFASLEQSVRESVLSATDIEPKSAIIAAAGPITPQGLNLTNCHWNIVPDDFLQVGSIRRLVLMNDFEAQALALPCLEGKDGVALGSGEVRSDHTKAVLGPGTGLGVGLLVRAGGKWIPVAGEGGHVDLGPRSAREVQIWQHLEAIGGRISAEQAVCGNGLVNLYRACCAVEKKKPSFRTPADISVAAMESDDPQAREALSLFCTTLGRVAGDLALTSMAKGGVYIGGGIAQKILPFLEASDFRSSFEDKAPHEQVMSSISTFIITHPLPALLGLAAFANAPETYLVDLSYRNWQRRD